MNAPDRTALLSSIADTVSDYRQQEIAQPDVNHVERWVAQFDEVVQISILQEMDYLLKRTYFSRKQVESFLAGLVGLDKLVGDNPCEFWKTTGLLDIQRNGRSQRELLEMFDGILRKKCGIGIKDCSAHSGNYVYLDDAIFTGNTLSGDMSSWLKDAPQETHLTVIVMGVHTQGEAYAKRAIATDFRTSGKDIRIDCWRAINLENFRDERNRSDVFWPSQVPNDPATTAYVQKLTNAGHPPLLRDAGRMGQTKVFSAENGRDILEQAFLKAGARIREQNSQLNMYQRPLGNSVLQTLGFGAAIVTFRNCPNNCPLAFWVGTPWYPLFPRKAN